MRNLLALCFLLLALPAQAECLDSKSWIESVREENPGLPIAKVVEIPPLAVAHAVKVYNETPPLERQVSAETGVLLIGPPRPNGTPAIIGLFHEGCIVGSVPIMFPPDGQGA